MMAHRNSHDDDDEPMLSETAEAGEAHVHHEAIVGGGRNKRSLADLPAADDDVEYTADIADNDPAKKKRKKAPPPPKKLNNEQWDMMFDRLVAFKSRYGHILVPKRYEHDKALGTWVETQRQVYRKLVRVPNEAGDTIIPNKRLNPERLDRLESIGFVWSARTAKKNQFPATCPADEPPPEPQPRAKKIPTAEELAARAVARQRQNDANWQEMYNRLAAYKEKYGDCLVPKKFEEDPKLANWVEAQRVLYNRGYRTGKPKTASKGDALPEPADVGQGKTPEEWAVEIDKADTATAEDAAEIAATMAEAAMEVVDEVAPAVTAAAGIPEEASEPVAPAKRLNDERKKRLDELGFVWSLRSKRVDDHWDEMFKLLVDYKEKHGDCLVPSRYEENPKLGKWIETQRYEMTKLQRAAEGTTNPVAPKEGGKNRVNPRLTEERRNRLEAIGFEWKVKNKMRRYYDRQWDAMFDKLLQFKSDNGHCLVPKRYPEDQKLGTWVHTQRIMYRKTHAGPKKDAPEDIIDDEPAARLTDDRFRRLDEIGFVWCARENEKKPEPKGKSSYDEQWDTMFERLKEFKEKHGHCLVPKRCPEDPKLGTWVDTQRVSMKKMRKQLGEQTSITSKDSAHDAAPTELASFDTAAAALEGGKSAGRLTHDRIAKLQSLGFVWSLRDDWIKHYNELVAFKQAHGHCNVPARYAANRKLGIWTSAQRQQYKLLNSEDEMKRRRAAPLTAERIALLNELGFTWTIRSRDSLGESWNQRLQELKDYKSQHGNTLVPSRFPPNEALGVWVGTQRTQYRLLMRAKEIGDGESTVSSAMTADRIRQLEDLGFVWTLRGASDLGWKKRVGDLEDFRATHGHAAVPRDYPPNRALAQWAADLRGQYRLMKEGRASSLDDGRVAEIDGLGFVWEEQDAPNLHPLHTAAHAQHHIGQPMGSAVHMDLEGVDDVGDNLLQVPIEQI